MPSFLLIRHGENEYVKKGRLAGRLPGVHLNDKGRAQALLVADKLGSTPIKAIYSSPLERAIETAEPLAKNLGLQVVSHEGLLETDYGEWQGKTLKSLRRRKLWRTVQNAPYLMRFPGGESFAECQLRICKEIETISQKHKPKDMIACFFHSDPIKLAVAYYIGLPLDNFQRLAISPASITALHISDSGSHLLSMNIDLSLNLTKH
jgi:probable phosphoglycerate mutase